MNDRVKLLLRRNSVIRGVSGSQNSQTLLRNVMTMAARKVVHNLNVMAAAE